MSRFARLTLAAAALALSATAAPAQIYPFTNGPNGAGTNTLDSSRGFDGPNAVASEREFLYHPERAGNAAALYGAHAAPAGGVEDDETPVQRPARHRRRHETLR